MDTHQNQTLLQFSQKRIKRQYNHHIINAKSAVDLPCDVLENIFSFLPIKQAVKLGILSSRFRNSWLFTRKLYFDKGFARGRGRADFIRIVDNTFNLHAGPIQSFRLYFDPTGVGDMVEKWIKNCINKGVEELDLDFFLGGEPFMLSSDIVDIESLKILKLCFCKVDLPPKLQGLSLLNTLVLEKVNITSRLLETVFYNCMSLEVLDLTQCYTTRHLKISARNLKKFKVLKVGRCPDILQIIIDGPTLRSLHYCGYVISFKFLEVLQLNDVIINFIPSRSILQYFQRKNLAKDLFHVSVLSTTGIFLESLCSRITDGSARDKLLCFGNLKEFQLFMKGASFCNVSDIAFFLMNCPGLENIFIDLNEFSFECGYYWELHHLELHGQFHQPFKHLKFIRIKGFKFQKYELDLVKFLLQKAICLETLVLVTPKNSPAKFYASLFDRIFHVWRTSPKAQIIISDYFEDRTCVYPKHSKIWF